MRKVIAIVLAGGLLVGMVSPSFGKPMTVFKDDSGDADPAQQGTGVPFPGGFDLVSGSINQAGANLEFTVTHGDMPPSGSLPEGFRFLWSFGVGSAQYRLTVKSADIGKPDLLQQQTTERVGRADVSGHFRLEGDCGSETVGALQAINCKPLAYLEGTWDPGAMSFTVLVPLKLIKAKKGSVIGPGAGDSTQICATQVCWVTHTAERSLSNTLIDTAVMTGSFKVK